MTGSFLTLNVERSYYEARTSIDDIINSFWSSCLSTPLGYINFNEISTLKDYNCSFLPCLSFKAYPYYFKFEYKENISFGICPLNEKNCIYRKVKVAVNGFDAGYLNVYICNDDMSKLISILEYNCINNKSFTYKFEKLSSLEIKKDEGITKLCIDNICNKISCNNIERIHLDSVSEVAFYYDTNEKKYKIYLIK